MRMIQQDVSMVPTLSIVPTICEANWYGIPEKFASLCQDLFIEVVRQFHDMGGIVVLGNDYGNQVAEPGMPIKEIHLLMEAGLSAKEVILTGTNRSASVCGQEQVLGSLETGKFADKVIVEGNPLEDIQAMARVSMVIKSGQIVYP